MAATLCACALFARPVCARARVCVWTGVNGSACAWWYGGGGGSAVVRVRVGQRVQAMGRVSPQPSRAVPIRPQAMKLMPFYSSSLLNEEEPNHQEAC